MICPVCGNEGGDDHWTCRFCGSALDRDAPSLQPSKQVHRVVNLERGRPTVETALARMRNEIERARSDRVRVLTIIHGYGSSGKGGAIRVECRKVLDHLLRRREIGAFVAGEQFRKRTGAGKSLLRRFPDLLHWCGSDFSNPGVTIVVLPLR